MIAMNKKVWDINSRKIDGRYNCGKVVGIKKIYEGLGFITEKQYLNDFVEYEYLFACVDVCTGRASAVWVHYNKLSLTEPKG
jgi:hypothetical protein